MEGRPPHAFRKGDSKNGSPAGSSAPLKSKILILSGPTGVGKSEWANRLAFQFPDLEIVSADSIQIYRGFDLGSAKPSPDEREKIPHHLIDVVEPGEPFTAARFREKALAVLEEIEKRGKRAVIVGGTVFYLKVLLHGLWDAPPSDPQMRLILDQASLEQLVRELETQDPDYLKIISSHDRYRVPRAVEILRLGGEKPSILFQRPPSPPDPRFSLVFLDREDRDLTSKIRKRTEKMIKQGLVEEAKELREKFPGAKALESVGYTQSLNYLDGIKPSGRNPKPGLPGLIDEISLATFQLAKAQRTFYKSEKQFQGLSPQFFLLDRDEEDAWSTLQNFYLGP